MGKTSINTLGQIFLIMCTYKTQNAGLFGEGIQWKLNESRLLCGVFLNLAGVQVFADVVTV